MATTIEVLDAFQNAIETALSMTCILGFPDLGRTGISYPLAAIVFESDGYGKFSQVQTQANRLGQTQPSGISIVAGLLMIAANERALSDLVDSLRGTKVSLSSVTAGGIKIKVRWGDTSRIPTNDDTVTRECMVRTDVLFTWI